MSTNKSPPLNGDDDDVVVESSSSSPPSAVAAVVAATTTPQAGGENEEEEEAPPPSSAPSITAVLEAANDLRKMDAAAATSSSSSSGDDDDDGNNNTNNDKNGTIIASPPPPQCAVEEIAEALSDGEEPFFDTHDDLDDSIPEEEEHGKPAYTAQTVAAISSLMKGGDDVNNNGGGGGLLTKKESSSSSAVVREISLQDRATAMISVYKDYIQEEDDDDDNDNDDVNDQDEDVTEMTHVMLDIMNGPIHNAEKPPPPSSSIIGNNSSTAAAFTTTAAAALHDFRREEIKLATIEKFCKDVTTNLDDNDDEYDDNNEDERGGSGDDGFGIYDYYEQNDDGSYGYPIPPREPQPRKPRHLKAPTAATTTAAFRLKAEVALKAVGSSITKKVAKKMMIPKGGGVGVKSSKIKVQSPLKNNSDATVGVESSSDSTGYHPEDYHKESSFAKGRTGTINSKIKSIVENDYDLQNGHDDDDDDDIIIQDERQDDLEYGITPDEMEEGTVMMIKQQQQQQQEDQLSGQDENNSMVYGIHILNRDKSLKRKLTPTEDNDIRQFNDLCDELGVTPATHPSLQNNKTLRHFYHLNDVDSSNSNSTTLRYKYAIFRTKKFKRSMLYCGVLLLVLCICASVLSAVSNGFEEVRKQKMPPLPDWKAEEDWRMKQKLEWEKGHAIQNVASGGGGGNNKVGITSSQGGPNNNDDMNTLFQTVSSAYRPIWYDRSTGWTGQTYPEAISWCNAHHNYIPCPYEVYCPNEISLLAGSVMDNDGESWAPVINAENEWVQVGSTGTPVCGLYSELYGKRPVWGEDGLNNEVITRHIMCCREHPMGKEEEEGGVVDQNNNGLVGGGGGGEHVVKATGPPPGVIKESQKHKEEVDLDILFLSMTKRYNPVWFDRDSGWDGQTYQESLNFCAKVDMMYIPCPYEVYCPGGHGKLLDGVQDQGESWSAVIDDANDWVQVGADGECNLYSETGKELPSWGMTGENNEEITRHIMCCHSAPHIASITGNDNAAASSTGSSSSGADSAMSNNEDVSGPSLVTMPRPSTEVEDMDAQPPVMPRPENAADPKTPEPSTDLEVKIKNEYHPVWFSPDFGWKGTTHNDARAFCESIPRGDDGDTLYLCPLEAYCPDGLQETKPLYVQMDAFDGVQWAPISNEDNGWVMVGKFSDDNPLTCQTYLSVTHHEPAWGLDGTSPELKEHILCCDDNAVNAGGVVKEDGKDSIDSPSENGDQGGGLTDKVVGIQPEVENLDSSEPGDDGSSSAGANMNTSNSEPSSSMTEWEMQIQNAHHPTWYSTEFGWQGTTYDDAKAFCESIPHGDDGGTLHLCPLLAYCPNGPRDTEPLYLQMDAFEGVQWAPFSNKENGWLMIGDIGGLTCQSYRQINDRDPTWGLDGSSTKIKEHILCCEDNSGNNGGAAYDGTQALITSDGEEEGDKLTDMVAGIQQEAESSDSNEVESVPDASEVGKQAFEHSITSTFNPVWFDLDSGGWDGGSHDDGIAFCEQFAGAHGKRMEVCPYAAYCPEGPSKPVIGGHMADFDKEGEQWAPVFGQSNHWVMIGKRGRNTSTTCLSHVQLTGEEPSWGLSGLKKETKKHIMCCSPFQ